MIDGTQHGGLASTGFTLVETGPSTGIFEGVFRMPSQICDKNGTELISTAGGSIELKYHDARDSSGKPNVFSSQDNNAKFVSSSLTPQLNRESIALPTSGTTSEIILSGNVSNAKQEIPLVVTMAYPDGNMQKFNASVTGNGGYKTIFTINSDSLVGTYRIDLDYDNSHVGSVSFEVIGKATTEGIIEETEDIISDIGKEAEDLVDPITDDMIKMQSMTADGEVMVSVYSGEPTKDEKLSIVTEFLDSNDEPIQDIVYDIKAIQDGNRIFSEEAVQTDRYGQHTTAVLSTDNPVDIEIKLISVEGLELALDRQSEMISFHVVPEFGTVVMVILVVAIISIIAKTNRLTIMPKL